MTLQERAELERADGEAGAAATPSLDSLYRAHSLTIRRHIERHFGSGPPDPEDAVQAAFMKYSAITDRSTVLQPLAFLKRCAYNFVIDFYREQKQRSGHAGAALDLTETCDRMDAERILIGRQRAAIIEAVLRNMDEKRRDVLLMSRIHGLTPGEIARDFGISRTQVRVRLAEAVALCQIALRRAERP